MSNRHNRPEEELSSLPTAPCPDDLLESALRNAHTLTPEKSLGELPAIGVPARVVEQALLLTRLARASSAPRRLGGSLAVAALVAVTVAVAIWAIPPQSAPLGVVILSGQGSLMTGGVERSASAGVALDAGDTLEASSTVVLAISDWAHLVVDPHSRVRVEARAGFTVLQGRAEGRIRWARGDGLRFTVERGLFRLQRGAVGVLRGGAGFVVAALGDADLVIDGESRRLESGSVVRFGAAHASVGLPAEISISLQQTEPIAIEADQVVVAGQTHPEVVLVIDDVPVPVDREGRFSVTLRVARDAERVRATARDALGHAHYASLELTRVDARARWKTPG